MPTTLCKTIILFAMHQEPRNNSLLYAVKLLVFLCTFLIFWYRAWNMSNVTKIKCNIWDWIQKTCIPKSTICKVIAQYRWLVKTSHHSTGHVTGCKLLSFNRCFVYHARVWHQALDWCTVRSAKYKVHNCDDGGELMIRWSNVHAIL